MASLQANDPRTWELTNAPFFQASLQPSPFFAQFLGQLDQDGNGSGRILLPPIASQLLQGVCCSWVG